MAAIPYAEWEANPKVKLGDLGAQPPMGELASEFQRNLHGFAENVMRPIGMRLDRLPPDDLLKEDSEYWEFRRQYLDLGIGMETLGSMEPQDLVEVFSVLFEELGWGDSGLAISAGASMLPHYISAKLGNEFVLKTYPDTMLGCWGITEPDHGSDTLDPSGSIAHANGDYGRPNCSAKITDGKVIIKGQKSAWVSNGPVAELCILYCAAETSSGADAGSGVCVVVPMSADGVSQGKQLHKMGQRALPQGEIFFDNVEVDIDHLLAGPEDYKKAVYCIHTEANALMGGIFTGVARAAFEHAHAYAHERKQGGVPIIRHQDVAKRLFNMFRKVELSRAITHRVVAHNNLQPMPCLHAAMTAKVTGTSHAFEVASDAIQMFGGNGVTHEYPVEKLFRDARSSMIEDGCNEVLSIKGGMYLIDEDLL